jgi:translation initiation factor 2 alpha subunit (eIF-2alpha)
MTKPMIRISDGVAILDREMTDDEYAQYLLEIKQQEVKVKAEKIAADAKAALLARLGITQEEANLLIGGSN